MIKIRNLLIVAGTIALLLQTFGLFSYLHEPGRATYSISSGIKNFDVAGKYIALLFLWATFLLLRIFHYEHNNRDKYKFHWLGLVGLMTAWLLVRGSAIQGVVVDYLRAIDEQIGVPVSLFIFGIPVLVALLLAYKNFLLALPGKTGWQFLLAGLVYLAGALVMEEVSEYAWRIGNSSASIFYLLVTLAEELLEMTGVIIFIQALLEYRKVTIFED